MTTRRDVVVVGASAGGVEALRQLVRDLPADFPATILVVLHVPPHGASALPAILERAGQLSARHANAEDELRPGRVLVAPPDRHLVVVDGSTVTTRGPKENGHRPAVDVLFRSAAQALGPRVIGVVLSGNLDDGTAGLKAVKTQGGVCIAQSPGDALYPGMPLSAVENVAVDHVVPIRELGELLVELCSGRIETADDPAPELMRVENSMALMDEGAFDAADRPGTPSGYSCPDCGGVLWELPDDSLIRFRCRVGHAWSASSLLGEQAKQLDDALWMALRGLEEKAALARTLRDRARDRGSEATAAQYEEQATENVRAADLIRSLLERPTDTEPYPSGMRGQEPASMPKPEPEE